MKKIISLVFLMVSFNSLANFWPNTGWNYGTDVCVAQTVCPNGQPIYCTVYGLNNRYGQSQLCRTRVVPGQFIHCQGYSQDFYGYWNPVNIPISCGW